MLASPQTSMSIARPRAAFTALPGTRPRIGQLSLRRAVEEHATSSFEEDLPDESGNGSLSSQNHGEKMTMPRSEQARRYFRTVRCLLYFREHKSSLDGEGHHSTQHVMSMLSLEGVFTLKPTITDPPISPLHPPGVRLPPMGEAPQPVPPDRPPAAASPIPHPPEHPSLCGLVLKYCSSCHRLHVRL